MRALCLFGASTLACAVLLLSTAVWAESPGGPDKESAPVGRWGLLFQVKSNFSLAPFQGTMVCGKRDLVGGDAVRFGLAFSAGFMDAGGDQTGDTNGAGIDVFAHYLHYWQREHSVSMFLGVGPFAGILSSTHSTRDDWVANSQSRSREDKSEDDRWSVGLSIVVGAEWAVTEHIAVTGEYCSSGSYSRTTSDRVARLSESGGPWEVLSEDHLENSGYATSPTEARLGLAIYF